jgi:hypothetical protein
VSGAVVACKSALRTYAGRIAARPGDARDETEIDRVFGDAENDGKACGRSLCCECRRGAHGNAITATWRRSSSLAMVGSRSYWPSANRYSKSDHRHRRLLCARRERPPCHRTPEQRETRRPAGPAIHEHGIGHQSQHREIARPYLSDYTVGSCRRGDRITRLFLLRLLTAACGTSRKSGPRRACRLLGEDRTTFARSELYRF